MAGGAVDYAVRSGSLTWGHTIFFAAAVASAIACGRGAPKSEPTPEPLAADVVGCASVRRERGGVLCELPEAGVLRVALPMGATAVRASADAGVTEREDGPLLTVRVPRDAIEVAVDAIVSGKPARATLRLAPPEKLAWLDDARAARTAGDLGRAEALARAHADDAAPIARALARGLLARIALSRGRADEAFPLFRDAIALHRTEGRISDAVDDSFALAFALHQRSRRYTEARAALDAIGDDLALYAEGRARAPYYRGSLAAETGDRRRALALLREAEHAA